MTAPDLTQLNQIATNLETYNYRSRPFVETLTNGYFIIDHKWTVVYWNKAAEKLLGITGTEIVGKNLWEKFVKSIPVKFHSIYDKAFLVDTPVRFKEYWSEMGSWFDVLIWNSANTLCVSFKSSNNQTQDPLERLKTLAELYRFVTEITNDCLWEWHVKTKEIFWIDGGHKKVFGYDIENALVPESFWEDCIHADDRGRVLLKLDNYMKKEHKTLWEDEYRFKKKDGTYCHVYDRALILYDETNTATRLIGATQDISRRVALENELTNRTHVQQKEMTASVLTSLENERTKIGMELHDNLGQVMAVAKMYIQMAKKSDENRDAHLDKALDHVQESINEIRKIAKSLIIPPAHIIGLMDNIRILIEDLTEVNSIKIDFHHPNIRDTELNEKLQINIFRITQEQINNIISHSNATHATVRLSKDRHEVTLLITDNGRGHNTREEKKGVGIINIRSRVELCHGTVAITSEPGKGYELKAVFPLKEPRKEI